MYTRTDTLNSRSYADQMKIAKNAMKTIDKIKQCDDETFKKHGAHHTDRPVFAYVHFTIPQLRMIAFDYAFSALENFMEHIGFILFDDWDSSKSQRRYIDKKEKLLRLHEVIETDHLPNHNLAGSKIAWESIINSIDPTAYNKKRNPIKHVHAGTHDGKKRTIPTNSTSMNSLEFDDLVRDTYLALTDNDCQQLIDDVSLFIQKIHTYLNDNMIMFSIYIDSRTDDAVEARKSLLRVFETNPYADTLYISESTVP